MKKWQNSFYGWSFGGPMFNICLYRPPVGLNTCIVSEGIIYYTEPICKWISIYNIPVHVYCYNCISSSHCIMSITHLIFIINLILYHFTNT